MARTGSGQNSSGHDPDGQNQDKSYPDKSGQNSSGHDPDGQNPDTPGHTINRSSTSSQRLLPEYMSGPTKCPGKNLKKKKNLNNKKSNGNNVFWTKRNIEENVFQE